MCIQRYFCLFLSVFVQMYFYTSLTLLNFLFIFGNYSGLIRFFLRIFFSIIFAGRYATSKGQEGHKGPGVGLRQ